MMDNINDVLIVNDTSVCRFAKVPVAIETLRHELIVQRHTHGHVSLPIPIPEYCHIETTVVGEAFVGYRMIPGVPLWRGTFAAITNPRPRRAIAQQLATFLNELHHIELPTMLSEKFPVYDTLETWDAMYHRIRDLLFPFMRPDARQAVAAHFEVT